MTNTSDTESFIASSAKSASGTNKPSSTSSTTGTIAASSYTSSVPKPIISTAAVLKRTIPTAEGSPINVTGPIKSISVTTSSVPVSHGIEPPLSHHPQSVPASPQSSSLKKKKQIISMATAQSATATAAGENTGRWTGEEHRLFLQGLEQHGKGWKKIASLIKSRTVVQIRTHAQKYFQKLSKARQNGEEGDVSVENHRGEKYVVSGNSSGNAKRRKSGTKRKAITSVVASAERESKRLAMSDKKVTGKQSSTLHLPVISPVLMPYLFSSDQEKNTDRLHDIVDEDQVTSALPSITTSHGTISGSALEDSLFRFLSPMAVESHVKSQTDKVNDIARQAGANPITVPSSDKLKSSAQVGGIVSPTGVNDFPQNWVWEADPPSWFSRGADVDELLDEADALDWLTDTGDLTEAYFPPPEHTVHNLNTFSEPSLLSLVDSDVHIDAHRSRVPAPIPVLESHIDVSGNSTSIQNIPALFESANNLLNSMKKVKSINLSSNSLFASATEAADAVTDDVQFHLFDAHLDEQAFVTALLDHSSDSQNILNHNVCKDIS